MRKLRNAVRLIPAWSSVLLIASPFSAQAAAYTVGWSKVAGGGGAGAGGQFSVTGTAGQADAHAARTTGPFSVTGGYWARPRTAAAPVNRPPVAGPDALVRLADTVIAKVSVAALLTNDSDPDADPLSLAGVADALPIGATVALLGPWVIYTAPALHAGPGSFTYTLSDGPGGHSVTGIVAVTQDAVPEPETGPNPVGVTHSAGNFTVSFLGVPGYRYQVQFTTDDTPPLAWQDFAPPAIYTAPETGAVGVFQHVDPNPPDAMRLYRAVPNP